MKRMTAILIISILCALSFLSVDEGEPASHILVAYFSATGNTKAVAQVVADHLGADLYEIVAEDPYTEADLAYYTGGRCDQEQDDPAVRPAIDGTVVNMDQYDLVLIGHPIWHGQAPRIISTFLESYDFSGKTLTTFCTSHSSPLGSSAQNLHSLIPADVTWLNSQRFPGNTTEDSVAAWLDVEIVPYVEENMKSKTLTLTIDGTLVAVEWENNDAVTALIERVTDAPLTVQMSMYGGFEQVGSLGTALPSKDERITTQAGDIVLYSDDQIVIFYGSNTWAYTRLGRIVDKDASELTELLGNGNVTVTIDCDSGVEEADPESYLTLPAGLKEIENEGFAKVKADAVIMPDGLNTIADDAFADSSIKVVYGKEGLFAQQYADTHGLRFIPISDEGLEY